MFYSYGTTHWDGEKWQNQVKIKLIITLLFFQNNERVKFPGVTIDLNKDGNISHKLHL